MHYFEFGKRDTTLYSGGTTASRNTGLDEILEINKEVANDGTIQNISRILIDFDYANISQSVQEGRIPNNAKYFLNWLKNGYLKYELLIKVYIPQVYNPARDSILEGNAVKVSHRNTLQAAPKKL